MEPKIAYIVTSGEYSDYSVRGVYLNQAAADNAAAFYNGRVEEYEIGEMPKGPRGMLAWVVYMLRDGTTKNVQRKDGSEDFDDFCHQKDGFFEMWARDEKHAVKIANERRVQLIANNQWEE